MRSLFYFSDLLEGGEDGRCESKGLTEFRKFNILFLQGIFLIPSPLPHLQNKINLPNNTSSRTRRTPILYPRLSEIILILHIPRNFRIYLRAFRRPHVPIFYIRDVTRKLESSRLGRQLGRTAEIHWQEGVGRRENKTTKSFPK